MQKKSHLFIAVCLVFTLVLGSLAGCGGQKAGSNAPNAMANGAQTPAVDSGDVGKGQMNQVTIAVAAQDWSSVTMSMMRDYWENYLAPAFDVKFIFSENVKDVDSSLSFLENAANSGATGYMDYAQVNPKDVIPIAGRADELGVYYAVNLNVTLDASLDELDHFCGVIGSDIYDLGQQFGDLTEKVMTGIEKPNVLICTAGAAAGNDQHYQSSVDILNKLSEMYGITYGASLEEIVRSDGQTEVPNDSDMKIMLLASSGATTFTDSVYQIIKDGDYDAILSVGPMYTMYESIVNDVEKAFQKDIKLISIVAMGDATYNSFHSLDSQGSPSLDGAVIKNSSMAGSMFALIYNAISMNSVDGLRNSDGTHRLFDNKMWTCQNAEEYDIIAGLDKDEKNYAYTIDDLGNMLYQSNPELNVDIFSDWCKKSSLEDVRKRRGL